MNNKERLEQSSYPDISDILSAKAQRRQTLAALSWEEKVAIVEQMRQLLPKELWKARATDEKAPGPVSESANSSLSNIVGTVNNWCQGRPVRLCVLFGSQVRGKTHPRSDVDLALWPTRPVPPSARLRWLRELETALAHDVSLVLVSPDLDPVVGFEIVRQGYLIFEAEPGLWAERRAHLWHIYNDSLPFRRAARQRLHEFAEEVRRVS
jgi:predicted nucleotidyltransferase